MNPATYHHHDENNNDVRVHHDGVFHHPTDVSCCLKRNSGKARVRHREMAKLKVRKRKAMFCL